MWRAVRHDVVMSERNTPMRPEERLAALQAPDIDGTTYPTAEHWMMAAKARLFDDATTPGRWRGLNLLGFASMDTRDQLRQRRAPGRCAP